MASPLTQVFLCAAPAEKERNEIICRIEISGNWLLRPTHLQGKHPVVFDSISPLPSSTKTAFCDMTESGNSFWRLLARNFEQSPHRCPLYTRKSTVTACHSGTPRVASIQRTGLQGRYGESRWLNQHSLNRGLARIHGSVRNVRQSGMPKEPRPSPAVLDGFTSASLHG